MQYSIIVSTYNYPEALNLVLAGLLAQLELHKDVELIIADDGSTKATSLLIQNYQNQLPGRIKHIWHEDLGFRKAVILNKAVAMSTGNYLLFLDGDCVPFPDYITEHKKLALDGYFVAGGRVLCSKSYTLQLVNNPELITQIFNWNFTSWIRAYAQKKVNKIFSFLRLNTKASWRYLRRDNWQYPKGCNIGLFKRDFIAVNGYDEVFCGWGHEDADLFIRLLHNEVKIKDGRFALQILHLWHKESNRTNATANYARLMDRLQDKKFILAEIGVLQYSPTETGD